MSSEVIERCRVRWLDRDDVPVNEWSQNNSFVFTSQASRHVAKSHLVFVDFVSDMSGTYTCELYCDDNKIDSSVIVIEEE